MDTNRTRCDSCGWSGNNSELLVAQNPFDESDEIFGCPRCYSVDDLHAACWKCDQDGSTGMPTEEHGYVWSCYMHRPDKTDEV